jgi:hypothetical protein
MGSSAKVLSVGLGDLVSARNAALRIAGFEVVSAITLEDVFQLCSPLRFDVAIVGHAFTIQERAQLVRCLHGVFRLPVILIAEGQLLASIPADLHIDVNAPTDHLVGAVQRLIDEPGGDASRAVAV